MSGTCFSNLMQVPVISLDQTEAAAAEEVRRACTRYGFFASECQPTPVAVACCCNKGRNCSTCRAVKDHGVPEELVDAALRENERFFALPLEQKMTCKINADYRVRSRECFLQTSSLISWGISDLAAAHRAMLT